MSDGSDGAGGVGNDGGSSGANAASSASDALGAAADAVGTAVDAAVDTLGAAISNALGTAADALGLDAALDGLANALGIDPKDLQGIVGAAVVGMLTGGLPGAVMGVVNGLVGGSLTEAARGAVADTLPAAMQPLANLAIDQLAGRIPGANVSVQDALAGLASGALTNGRAPDIGDIGAIARSLTDVQSAARGLMDGVAGGHFASAADAASAIDSALGGRLDQARDIAGGIADTLSSGRGAYASGGHDRFGDAVEQLAVDVTRLVASRR
ncbi:hypothetical protein [Luteimonas terrae]|uniref:DUF937 domain-containing protein n=1 Tax=Luteimonas terrae TaxID=1530191 RepID=A0A4R5U5K6_9GAMM|nr:hypothetical protein [Luteimonas terrae]TDK29226.1 hypothetical protein E2F49_14915 [Luteimonas terrae]